MKVVFFIWSLLIKTLRLMKYTLLQTGCLTMGCFTLTPLAFAATEDRPNILFIMSDDHTSQAVSAYHSILADVAPTPNIDRLANEGALMENCFVTNSISTPSRGAIITGQYSQKNHVYTLADQLDPGHPNVAKYLQAAGYQTAMVGKWHLHAEPTGFDWYNVLPGQGRYHNPELIEKGMWGNNPRLPAKNKKVYPGHSTDIIAGQALNFIKNRNPSKPFFLMCHFKAPHRNWICADRFKDKWKDTKMPMPANLLDTYVGKGQYADSLRLRMEDLTPTDVKRPIPAGMTRDEQREWAYQFYIKDYLRCVAGVDENVGKILDYLDENGLTKNTVVIYTGDQGFFLGEHGWFDKRLMYEECLRAPFLIRYPKEIKAGTVNKDIVLNIDYAPLFLDYAGIAKPSQMQGESFRTNVEGCTPANWRKAMYYRYWMHNDPSHHVMANYGIRTQRYKLVYYYGKNLKKSGARSDWNIPAEWELYDLKTDPNEMHNLYTDPANKSLINELKMKLIELKKQYGDEDDQYPVMRQMADQYYW